MNYTDLVELLLTQITPQQRKCILDKLCAFNDKLININYDHPISCIMRNDGSYTHYQSPVPCAQPIPGNPDFNRDGSRFFEPDNNSFHELPLPTPHIQHMQYVQPIQHMQPAQPTQPTQHMQHMQPAQPTQHMQHMQPTQHAQPMQHTQHAQHMQHTQHAQPMQHMQPTQRKSTSNKSHPYKKLHQI